MSIQTRKELLFHIKKRYVIASSKDKRKILDEFVSMTKYSVRHEVAEMSCFYSLNTKPSVSPDEPRGLNKERP